LEREGHGCLMVDCGERREKQNEGSRSSIYLSRDLLFTLSKIEKEGTFRK
jgi:hypothetical protein